MHLSLAKHFGHQHSPLAMINIPQVIRSVADAFEDIPTLIFKLKNRKMVSFNFCKSLKEFARSEAGQKISAIFDVGANEGQFALMAHYCWPQAQIFSFEPDERAVQKYLAIHKNDSKMRVRTCALGEVAGSLSMKFAKVSAQNSFLVEPGIKIENVLNIPVYRFDDLVGTLPRGDVLLKVDVQGFELSVLRGATNQLPRITWLLLEVSLVNMYEGGCRIEDILGFVRSQGFVYWAIMDQYRLPRSRKVAQMDVLFGRP